MAKLTEEEQREADRALALERLEQREQERLDREKKIKEDDIYKFLVEKGYKKVWSGSSYCSHLFSK